MRLAAGMTIAAALSLAACSTPYPSGTATIAAAIPVAPGGGAKAPSVIPSDGDVALALAKDVNEGKRAGAAATSSSTEVTIPPGARR
jgi:hypothetical protein